MKKYTEQDKTNARKLLDANLTAREVSEILDIPVGTLNRWRFEEREQGHHKWTDDDHALVAELTDLGYTVEAIAEETGLSVGGIKRSRSLRLAKQKEQQKEQQTQQQAGAEGSELLQLRKQVLELEAKLRKQSEDLLEWQDFIEYRIKRLESR